MVCMLNISLIANIGNSNNAKQQQQPHQSNKKSKTKPTEALSHSFAFSDLPEAITYHNQPVQPIHKSLHNTDKNKYLYRQIKQASDYSEMRHLFQSK